MESEFLCGLENFDAVWQRVRGDAPPHPPRQGEAGSEAPAQAALLKELMDGKCAQARLLTALAPCFGGAARQKLLCMAEEEKRHFRCLQLEYFLLTGTCHRAGQGSVRFAGRLSGLRLAWQGECAAAERLRTEAGRSTGTLRAALDEAARADGRHAESLYALLRCAIVG